MKSITDLRNAVQMHTAGMQQYRWNPDVRKEIWNKLLPNRKMPNKRRMTRKRGGASYSLSGAPLDYAMTPGSAFTTNPSIAVYDRFPIDPTVNPQVVSDLDVFFGSALTRGCGIENSSLTVPADMGSNKVGGGKRRRTVRSGLRGGSAFMNGASDLGSTLSNHPYMNSSTISLPHSLTHQWQGRVDNIPASSDPTDYTWKYATEIPRVPTSSDQLFTRTGTVNTLMHSIATPVAGGARKNKRSLRHRKAKKSRKTQRRRK